MTAYITVNIPCETQFRRDILTTAVEGGIHYWINEDAVNEEGVSTCEVARASDLSVTCVSWEAEGAYFAVNDIHILDALQRIVRGDKIKYLGTSSRNEITSAVQTQDAGEIDADLADVIFQIAAFGEVVYG